jgi:SlyX protein
MGEAGRDDARLDALETTMAHQDAAIEDLNKTITAQWRKIDALAREVAMLTERLHDLGRREPGEAEPPPPQY